MEGDGLVPTKFYVLSYFNENLNQVNADVIFIKNIDNVSHSEQGQCIFNQKILRLCQDTIVQVSYYLLKNKCQKYVIPIYLHVIPAKAGIQNNVLSRTRFGVS